MYKIPAKLILEGDSMCKRFIHFPECKRGDYLKFVDYIRAEMLFTKRWQAAAFVWTLAAQGEGRPSKSDSAHLMVWFEEAPKPPSGKTIRDFAWWCFQQSLETARIAKQMAEKDKRKKRKGKGS
jgi:hypothetical protein